jgi:hypothetical protein
MELIFTGQEHDPANTIEVASAAALEAMLAANGFTVG